MTDYIALADKLSGYGAGDEFQRPVEEAESVIRALAKAATEDERGWKRVPIEPTAAMLAAVKTKPHPTRPDGWSDRNAALYRAMVSAAPVAALSVAPIEPAQDREDAQRYRWLRLQYWNDSSLFVVAGSHSQVRLGTDCPTHDRLDAAIDAARQAPKEPT